MGIPLSIGGPPVRPLEGNRACVERARESEAVSATRLRIDPAEIRLDRLLAEANAAGDLSVRASLLNQECDLNFGIGEKRPCRRPIARDLEAAPAELTRCL